MIESLTRLNPLVKVVVYNERLVPQNSFKIFTGFDLVLDCTDSPQTRYLVNDTAVLLGIPLVSASALKTEGQLSILNFKNGPCYRCLFPVPPPPDTVTSCGDGGILGPVVGIMGVSQAVEAIKIITNNYTDSFSPGLTLYNAFSTPSWRYIRMRGRKPNCAVCGESPIISRSSIQKNITNYVEFCGRPSQYHLEQNERISVEEYHKLRDEPHVLIDVRDQAQFEICSLPGSINIPYSDMIGGRFNGLDELRTQNSHLPVYVICRYGNDSQPGTKYLKEVCGLPNVKDIKGGLDKWSDLDPSFPRY